MDANLNVVTFNAIREACRKPLTKQSFQQEVSRQVQYERKRDHQQDKI